MFAGETPVVDHLPATLQSVRQPKEAFGLKDGRLKGKSSDRELYKGERQLPVVDHCQRRSDWCASRKNPLERRQCSGCTPSCFPLPPLQPLPPLLLPLGTPLPQPVAASLLALPEQPGMSAAVAARPALLQGGPQPAAPHSRPGWKQRRRGSAMCLQQFHSPSMKAQDVVKLGLMCGFQTVSWISSTIRFGIHAQGTADLKASYGRAVLNVKPNLTRRSTRSWRCRTPPSPACVTAAPPAHFDDSFRHQNSMVGQRPVSVSQVGNQPLLRQSRCSPLCHSVRFVERKRFVEERHLLPASCGCRSRHVEATRAEHFRQTHPAAFAAQQPRRGVQVAHQSLSLRRRREESS